ncbi:MAG: hypothetical protein WAU28_05360 [Candidatus Moraniibacteriota bacterium]
MSISERRRVFFEKILVDFFRKVGREYLPWRKKDVTAYEVWVSEIMLQQTQVSRVIGYYERFLKKYPTVQPLAKSSWEEFLPYYEGLGYYARGRNMLLAAKVIVAEYDGKFPCDRRLLEAIPGIGPYTASAILSFAYGENHLAWDTNLNRVIGRFFFGSRRAEFDTEDMSSRFSLPAKTMNAALMDFGSALCLARPKCEACPLRTRCLYYKEGGMQETIQNTKYEIQNTKVDWKGARAVVFLHENHRKYFSSQEKKYEPFVLPSGYNSRAGIKDWFMKKYNLIVSVRPPHRKLILRKQATLLVNAQILSGNASFFVFSKKDFQSSIDDLIKEGKK